ncbi:uncharacterized protein BXZ73DRAFT_98472 [Epithele typhae]|uniref:uncharacterized protein n=1 Tax=Epithele typhae TaxID=378194 RepID=UPI0020089236|nr:uncharacterized protein BXZ73DRAFT_98472 [Epithele typhae]KAH9941256.1 hypothetical protein BXZ73DRAFT_98472 [Epithele typhae]
MSDFTNDASTGNQQFEQGGMNQGGMNQQGGMTDSGTQQTGEKQDWLDKGIEGVGKKFGVNVSDQNADRAGDFANKEFTQRRVAAFLVFSE